MNDEPLKSDGKAPAPDTPPEPEPVKDLSAGPAKHGDPDPLAGWSPEVESIPLTVEPASPVESRASGQAPARDHDNAVGGEATPPDPPPRPAKPRIRKKAPSVPQPPVYELDWNLPDELLKHPGPIDWNQALSGERAGHPPSKTSTPGDRAEPSEAQALFPLSEEFEVWRNLPGADKVLRRQPGFPPSPLATPEKAGEERPPSPPPGETASSPLAESPLSRYEQLKRRASMPMDPEAVRTANEFSEILFHINRALHLLQRFREKYAFLIAPNVFAVWEDNLKETAATMMREFQTLKNPRTKQYEKKYVCRLCKSVFFVSLPEGICDECRGKMGPDAPDL